MFYSSFVERIIYESFSHGDKNINQDLQSLKKDIAHEKLKALH